MDPVEADQSEVVGFGAGVAAVFLEAVAAEDVVGVAVVVAAAVSPGRAAPALSAPTLPIPGRAAPSLAAPDLPIPGIVAPALDVSALVASALDAPSLSTPAPAPVVNVVAATAVAQPDSMVKGTVAYLFTRVQGYGTTGEPARCDEPLSSFRHRWETEIIAQLKRSQLG